MGENASHRRQLTTALTLGLVLLTGAHWLILILRLPIFKALPGWFYPFQERPIQMTWILVAAAALAASAAISCSKATVPLMLASLIVLGAAVQFSFAYSKGQGLDGLRDRIVSTGHAEFARVAVAQRSMIHVAKDYEAMVSRGELGHYAPSKPPGTLLFYMLTERLANLCRGGATSREQLESLRTFTSIVWPVFSYLVLIPLFLLGRSLFDSDAGVIACLLYVCLPSVTLITLHTDQVLYPLLAVVPVMLASWARRRHSVLWAFVAGIALYLAVFCSFGLIFVALLVAAALSASLAEEPAAGGRLTTKLLGATAGGAIACDLAARVLLGYAILTRYLRAADYHAHWKGWDAEAGTLFGAGATNIVEFAVWLGIPMALLLLAAVCYALRPAATDNKLNAESLFAFALALTFVLLLMLGRTKAETARLWLFLVPFICVIVARFLRELAVPGRRQGALMALVLVLEFGTTYLTVRFQDFH